MLVLLQLALAFAKIGLLTLGGGLAMLPLVRNEMLDHHWLTEMEFVDILGLSEATPGPLAVNCATFVGWRVAGLPGALTATLSLIAPSFLCVLLFGVVWRRYRNHPGMARVLGILRPVIAGLILAVALRLCFVVLGASLSEGGWGQAWRPLLVAGTVGAGVLHGKVSPVLLLLAGAGIGAWLC
jgi:chromate transporter